MKIENAETIGIFTGGGQGGWHAPGERPGYRKGQLRIRRRSLRPSSRLREGCRQEGIVATRCANQERLAVDIEVVHPPIPHLEDDREHDADGKDEADEHDALEGV